MVLYKESAFAHGYSPTDIERVLDNPLSAQEVVTSRGSRAISMIGFTSSLGLIDVRYQAHPISGEPVVFHAQKVPPRTMPRQTPRHRH